MGIVIKQSFKILSITYFGMIIGLINTLWLYPLLLNEEQIGLVRILVNSSVLLTSFAALGASQITIKYFPYFKDEKNNNNGFLTFIILLSTVGFIFLLIVLFLSKQVIINIYASTSPLLIQYLNFIPIIVFFVLFFSIFESYAVVNHKSVVVSFLKEFVFRLIILVGLYFLLINLILFSEFILIIVIAYALILILLILFIYRNKILFIKSPANIFKGKKLKEIIVFGLFVLMGNVAGSIMINIDGLMLSAFEGLRSAGIYTIAYFIATIIEVPRRSLSQAIVPFVSNANKENDFNKLKTIYKSSSINQLFVGGLIFILIWCNIDNIFKLIPNGDIYKEGKWVVFFLGLGKLFDLATGVNSEIVGTSKYYKYDLVFFILLGVLGIATNLYFIPKYGINGAAIATALSIFLVNTVRYIFIYITFKMQPFSFNTLTIVLILFITNYFSTFIPTISNLYLDIIINSILLLLFYLTPLYFLKISPEINNTLISLFNRLKVR